MLYFSCSGKTVSSVIALTNIFYFINRLKYLSSCSLKENELTYPLVNKDFFVTECIISLRNSCIIEENLKMSISFFLKLFHMEILFFFYLPRSLRGSIENGSQEKKNKKKIFTCLLRVSVVIAPKIIFFSSLFLSAASLIFNFMQILN